MSYGILKPTGSCSLSQSGHASCCHECLVYKTYRNSRARSVATKPTEGFVWRRLHFFNSKCDFSLEGGNFREKEHKAGAWATRAEQNKTKQKMAFLDYNSVESLITFIL